jgi:lysophospholipase L1-like esterase/predicted small lipoprotein YifL
MTWTSPSRIAQGATVITLLVIAACGHNGPTPLPDAPSIACPANVTVSGVVGGAQAVSYPAATVTGGTQPVSVTCSPGSGTTFSLGATTISCTATDASARNAQCTFTVTLTPALRLAITKFMAFGDSFTEGEDGRSLRLVPHFIDRSGTYPFLLEGMLNNEYAGQGIEVLNEGQSGEFIDKGRQRLPGALAAQHPQALLLLDGYNDLLFFCAAARPQDAASSNCAQATTDVVSGYRKMIQSAKSAGVAYVFASTLTPSGPYIPGPSVKNDRRIALSAIVATNTKLVPMVRAEGAILVDSFAAFVGHEAEYVADDGLHPRRAGYQALAETFFAAIKNTVASTPALRGEH